MQATSGAERRGEIKSNQGSKATAEANALERRSRLMVKAVGQATSLHADIGDDVTMRKFPVFCVAAIAAAGLFLAASPQDPATARVALKYGDRCHPLIGKQFGLSADRMHARQYDSGAFKLASVGVDYAEFHSDDSHVLVPLSVLRLEMEVAK